MELMELIQNRNKQIKAAKDYAESHKTEKGTLTKEDYAVWEKMEQDVKDLSREISRRSREAEMEKELDKPMNTPIVAKPIKPSLEDETPKSYRASNEYKKAMLEALRSNFSRVSDVLQEGVDADGGYLVPEEYNNRLITKLEEENIVRKLAHVLTTSAEHKINIASTTPAASWIEEGSALSFGEATFTQVLLDAHKLHVAVKVTEELLYDSAFDLENYLMDAFGKALSNAEEDAFLNGDGTGKPTGIFAATGGGTLYKQLTADIKADNLIDFIYSLKRPYCKNAAFILNDQLIAQIRKFKDTNQAYIWQPSYQVNEPNRLLGYPVYTSAFAPTDAIAFGDFSYYNIGDRGTRSFAQLRELFAGNGMVAFLAKERVDGKLILPEAVQILKLKATTTGV